MAQTINTNVASLNAQRNLTSSQGSLATSLQRLSSGLRINSAKDDAAGLAISERFSTQIRGINQAVRNANDGISLAQTAEGALSSVGENLQRMRELAVQSANATNSSSDRVALQKEISQLAQEIDRVATQTEFNGKKLLDGTFSTQKFQVGANVGQQISVESIANSRTSALGQYQGFTTTASAIGTATAPTATTVQVGTDTAISLGSLISDAKDIANAINAAGVAGLSATANETVVAAGTSAVTGASVQGNAATVTVNGLAINVVNAKDAQNNRSNLVTALNSQSAVTGVTATDTGSGVKLSAADGRNIVVGFAAGTSATVEADFGLAAATTTRSTIQLNYQAPEGKTGNVVFAGALTASGTIAATGTSVSNIDISTGSGAETALRSIDAALSTISSARAGLGAVQNRFSSAVANLQTTSENLSASRGRILDADFATETANLTRGQILQQAGTAMLAQANSLPQNVLSLLRG